MTDDDDEPKPKAAPRGNRNRALAIGVLVPIAICCLCGGGLMLARGSFARYLARAALAEHGISCGDGFDVAPNSDFTRADIAPCTCTVEHGPVESFELVDSVTVDLEDQSVTHVHAGHVIISMRAGAPAVEAGSLGPVASMLGVPARIGAIVGAASQLAAMDVPALEIPTLDVQQGGHTTVTVLALALDGEHPLGLSASHVTLPALTGPLGASATVTIDDITGTATQSDVTIAGDLALNGSAPIVGTVTRNGPVTVSGSALDTDAPSYRIEL